MKFLKLLFKLVLALAIAAAGVLTVLFEYFPESVATQTVAPYCEGPYLIAKFHAVSLYDLVKERLTKKGEAPEGSEPAAEKDAVADMVGTMKRGEVADEPEPKATESKADDETPSAPTTLAKAHWYSHSRVSESSCRGKVVLVCVWNEEVPESFELLAQTQRIADGFGRKRDFVVFASHCGGRIAAAQKELARVRVTFPVCEAAGLPCAQRISGTPPYFYLVDKTGKLKYIGRSDKAVLTKMADLF